MVTFNATNQGSQGTLSVFFADGSSKTLQSTHPAYVETLTYLATTPEDQHDEAVLQEMVNPAIRIGRLLQEVDPKYGFDLYTLSYDGLPLTGPLADLIKQRLNNRAPDWERFARFASRLESNPSYNAKQSLFTFVKDNGLTILADGRFVGHKAVNVNGFSQHAGPNNFINGVLYGKPGESVQVPHFVGSVISKRRGDVDDGRMACSTGLHVGSLRYASGFAPVLLTVAVAPEDVVGGEFGSKFRTARYEVLGMNESKAAFVGDNYEIVDRSEEVSAAEFEFAFNAQVKSRAHEWAEGEQDEYNSLPSVGRRLYDNIRTLLNKSHDAAYAQALAEYGTYEEYLARRDAERAAEAAAAAPEPVEATGDDRALLALAAMATMDDKAKASVALSADLAKTDLGHKPLARKWADAGVTETSVRRYRKAHNIGLTFGTKVKDALS